MQQEYLYDGKAMGTDFSIVIVCHNNDLADTLAHAGIEKIRTYEARFSRFQSTSELTRVNTEKDTHASPIFMEVTQKAYELFVRTKGIFNPLVQIEKLGYTKNFEDIAVTNTAHTVEEYDIDFSATVIDSARSRIILNEGQKLDFGGFLKGYLAEVIAREIKEHSPLITGVIVNIGGDIHAQGYDVDENEFAFTIYNPVTKDEDTSISLHNKSLATSGTYKRTWVNKNSPVHHILDMSGTRNPDSDIVSASVIHEDGGTSEAYTKVFLSMKPEDASLLLQEETLPYLLIRNNGEVIKNCI